MMIFAKYSFLLMLFALCYLFVRALLHALIRQRKARYRLHYVRHARIGSRLSEYLAQRYRLYSYLSEMLESVESSLTVANLLMISVLLFLGGAMTGALFFQSFKGVAVVALICVSLPFMALRMKLVSLRMHTRLDFLPAVEVFYQYYMIAPHKNLRTALQACLEEERILYPIKPVFEQLYRNLMTQRDTEESLRIFSLTLGHVWADYFVGIVRVALTEGSYVGESLKVLITDMRKAQISDQAERNKLLEIRIANFTPILFLALFLFINFKINPESAYQYYVLDPGGRNMLLDAMLLIFSSFLMGIYLSLRRM